MTILEKETFICLDIEATGLDTKSDKIIEIAMVKFTFSEILDKFETLIDPKRDIPKISQDIHNISDDMVKGKPFIEDVLPDILNFIKGNFIVGHGIGYDISLIDSEAKRSSVPCSIISNTHIDTLRLARLYGESPVNSLEALRKHFNIAFEGAHRAMNDVIVNIEVFKRLTNKFKTTSQLLNRLRQPILIKAMPLGKHKGRPFSEIPEDYLRWAVRKDFDQDLIFSIKTELKNRQKRINFGQAANPFYDL
ncbi:MAG: DNA polymerase III PolC-type [Candidatus Anoxychlamydiales bacterium]|nr:DNA polymerase III PolC-type [Candidatus Anoxychlamydiales bacterium]